MAFLISTVENHLNGILNVYCVKPSKWYSYKIYKSDNRKPLIWYSKYFTAENHQKGSIISTP